MREWLGDQLTTVRDRLLLPVPVPGEKSGKIDTQVRHWPVWAVGTDPVAHLAALQDAEHLGRTLRAATDAQGRVRPAYRNPLEPVSSGPDLGAYRRFCTAERLPSCFVPAAGATFVRIDLGELPLALLGAPPSRALATGMTADTGIELTTARVAALAALASSGASDATVAVGLGRLAGLAVTREQAGQLVRALAGRVSELADHLHDPTPDRLERHTRATNSELARWTGHTPPEMGGEGSLFRSFLASGLTDEFAVIGPDHEELLARLRRRGVLPPTGRLPNQVIDLRRQGYRFIEREPVTTRSGRVISCDTWVEARAAAACSAHQTVLHVAFALVEAGHRVVAVTPTEVLVEQPQQEVTPDAIGKTVTDAVTNFLGRSYPFPAPETIDRW